MQYGRTSNKILTSHRFFLKSGAGFTLIELLVVIAIIGILTSVVMVSMNDARVRSRDAKRVGDIKQIQLALELFYDSRSSYPTTTLGVLAPVFIPVIPKDPSTGASYSYAAMGTASGAPNTICPSYHLGAVLENKSSISLNDDVDAEDGTACSGTDFDGTDDPANGVFDMIP